MKSLVSALLLWFGLTSGAWATNVAGKFSTENDMGIGVGLGSVDGISMYYRMDQSAFAQGFLSFSDGADYYISGDYCFQYPGTFIDAPYLVPYYCLGGFIMEVDWGYYHGRWWSRRGDWDDHTTFIGAHVPLGLQVFIPQTPLQVYGELAPSLFITPGTYVSMFIQLGIRFLF